MRIRIAGRIGLCLVLVLVRDVDCLLADTGGTRLRKKKEEKRKKTPVLVEIINEDC